jgi:hypothetical protein
MNDNTYKNLLYFLKHFKDRPNNLAKFLIDNGALDKEFLNKIKDNTKLNDLNDIELIHFFDISQMKDYYNSLIDNNEKKVKKKDLSIELNNKLNNYLKYEKYEEAAKLRDFMIKNKIEIKSKI